MPVSHSPCYLLQSPSLRVYLQVTSPITQGHAAGPCSQACAFCWLQPPLSALLPVLQVPLSPKDLEAKRNFCSLSKATQLSILWTPMSLCQRDIIYHWTQCQMHHQMHSALWCTASLDQGNITSMGPYQQAEG